MPDEMGLNTMLHNILLQTRFSSRRDATPVAKKNVCNGSVPEGRNIGKCRRIRNKPFKTRENPHRPRYPRGHPVRFDARQFSGLLFHEPPRQTNQCLTRTPFIFIFKKNRPAARVL